MMVGLRAITQIWNGPSESSTARMLGFSCLFVRDYCSMLAVCVIFPLLGSVCARSLFLKLCLCLVLEIPSRMVLFRQTNRYSQWFRFYSACCYVTSPCPCLRAE